ncbi:MAG: S-methyl-5-thioribose-1-phosphate isomerase [Deltaproteobacteria bacterium]|nr:S-methyl-5-thioribose-1-phosphate isomerase [Deltaproteobacteria bacterium]
MTLSQDHLPIKAPLSGASYSAVELAPENDRVWMLEQRELPDHERYLEMTDVATIEAGIRDMVVRGAPAIGIAAAYGMVLAAGACRQGDQAYLRALQDAGALLKGARPTAVNLAWAIDEMLALAAKHASADPASRVEQMASRARDIHRADVEACRTMGKLGAERVPDGATILTHCNAGALATGGYGTALGVIRAAHEAGKKVKVLADETRPYLQGARLTSWELHRDGIPVEVITDNMAAHFFQRGEISLAVVGSDRIARNGDVANKIGTYGVACLARLHDRPFYVAAPWSTVDMKCASGEAIPIEQRASREVTVIAGKSFAPDGVNARYPGFDVTPARLVSAIFTERGAVDPVCEDSMQRLAR